MRTHKIKKYTQISFVISALLVGCAAPPTLYQWEGYQPLVYEHFKGQGNTPEVQLGKLEQDLEKIRAKDNTPPPGFHAHLGLLYSQIGKIDQTVQQFQTEKKLYPESAPYMDLLLKKIVK
ncbi:MAG: DUF4810 domain-containing protein [Candidatus Nitrotoga sp.]